MRHVLRAFISFVARSRSSSLSDCCTDVRAPKGPQRIWPEPTQCEVPSGRVSASVSLCERPQGLRDSFLGFPPNFLGRRRVPVGRTLPSRYPSELGRSGQSSSSRPCPFGRVRSCNVLRDRPDISTCGRGERAIFSYVPSSFGHVAPPVPCVYFRYRTVPLHVIIKRQARRLRGVGYGATPLRLTGADGTSTDAIQGETRWGAPPPPGRILRTVAINTGAAPSISPESPPLDPTYFISEPARAPPTTPAMPPSASGSASRWVNPAKEYDHLHRQSPTEASLRYSAVPHPVEQWGTGPIGTLKPSVSKRFSKKE